MRDDGPGVGEYVVDCKGVSLSRETLERISIVLGA
jgi:hypothetical protein